MHETSAVALLRVSSSKYSMKLGWASCNQFFLFLPGWATRVCLITQSWPDDGVGVAISKGAHAHGDNHENIVPVELALVGDMGLFEMCVCHGCDGKATYDGWRVHRISLRSDGDQALLWARQNRSPRLHHSH